MDTNHAKGMNVSIKLMCSMEYQTSLKSLSQIIFKLRLGDPGVLKHGLELAMTSRGVICCLVSVEKPLEACTAVSWSACSTCRDIYGRTRCNEIICYHQNAHDIQNILNVDTLLPLIYR